jgi:hypothetical protein
VRTGGFPQPEHLQERVGLQGRLIFVFTIIVINVLLLVIFIVVVTIGDMRKE